MFRSLIPDRRAISEEGQSLIEVVIALAVLVVVLVPALLLVTSSTKVVYNNQFKVTAANLANGQLEADRTQAVASGLPLPTPPSPHSIGSESYVISQQSGWCAPPITVDGVTTQWGPYSQGKWPYAYGVTVTVTWKGDPAGVQAAGVLTTPPGMFPPGTFPPTTTSCPL
ncbi:MAG: hypothetical protein ACYCV7_14480 [Acidimicrobiales bacterium]